MTKMRIMALLVILAGLLVGYFVYSTERAGDASRFPFSYGLDLAGGTRLVYRADVSQVPAIEVTGAMTALSQTIERRVNLFGVSEAVVTTESGSVFGASENEERLIVELPGITDVSQAVAMIGETPLLEFRLEHEGTQAALILAQTATTAEQSKEQVYAAYQNTGLSGGQLKRASVLFGTQVSASPQVLLQFNAEGADLFASLTEANIGKEMAIFLDGTLLSAPVIQTAIYGGEANITGNFTAEEARDLAQNLNFGALPLPIELIETNTIGPSLGHVTLEQGVDALLIAFIGIAVFLIGWYRLPGVVAVISLVLYGLLTLALFKLIPVTLTASGLAGFILSIGMAVDANVLISERLKEELRAGKSLKDAISIGFARAWLAIRDGNVTSVLTAAILYWMSSASVVKGFALVLGLGIVISMLTAVLASRVFLFVLAVSEARWYRSLFSAGFSRHNK